MFSMEKFKFVQADTADLMKKIYQLRFEIFAQEFEFEKLEDHPNGFETDIYDPHSIHFAAIDENEDLVGTVRLVLNSDKGFPIEHSANIKFIGEKPPPDRIAEVSRLAVSKNFRRRKVDGLYGIESYLSRSEGGILPDKGPVLKELKKNPYDY